MSLSNDLQSKNKKLKEEILVAQKTFDQNKKLSKIAEKIQILFAKKKIYDKK